MYSCGTATDAVQYLLKPVLKIVLTMLMGRVYIFIYITILINMTFLNVIVNAVMLDDDDVEHGEG